MANGMMAPEQQPMSEQDVMIQKQIDDGTLKVSGIAKNATEGDATNFVISAEQFVSTLDENIINILETKLTPSMRQVLGTILGPEVSNLLDKIGLKEPQHLVPHSVIARAFPEQTIEESIEKFDQLIGAVPEDVPARNIPSAPQGGLGGAPMAVPQTNVPPVV